MATHITLSCLLFIVFSPVRFSDSTAAPLAMQRVYSPANRFATGPTPARLLAYGLKHTALSRMIRAGVDIVTVSEIAGHSDIKMTMIYCHSDGQSKREAVEKVSRIYFQPPKVADAPAAAAQPTAPSAMIIHREN